MQPEAREGRPGLGEAGQDTSGPVEPWTAVAGAWSPARGAGPLVLGTISPLYPFHPCIGTFFPTPPSSPRSTTSPRRQPPEAGEGRAPARLWLSVKWGILRQEAAGPPSLLPVPTSSQDSLSPRQGQCPASPPAPLGFYPSHPLPPPRPPHLAVDASSPRVEGKAVALLPKTFPWSHLSLPIPLTPAGKATSQPDLSLQTSAVPAAPSDRAGWFREPEPSRDPRV